MFSLILGFLLFLFWSVLVVFFSVVAVTCVHLFSLFTSAANVRQLVVRTWGKANTYAGLSSAKVYSKENVIKEPCIIASNHRSIFDIFVTVGFLPIDFLFLAKKQAFNIPFIGGGMYKVGYIDVDRKSARNAAKSTIAMIDNLIKGNNILIYPEGTRNLINDDLLPFKGGIALVAEKAKVPILPVVLCGTRQAYSEKKPYRIYPTKIKIKILKAIYPNDKMHPFNKKSKLTKDAKLKEMHNIMEKEYKALRSAP